MDLSAIADCSPQTVIIGRRNRNVVTIELAVKGIVRYKVHVLYTPYVQAFTFVNDITVDFSGYEEFESL